jgi:hypothetical protein
MHIELRAFLARLTGTILMALAPVVFTAFVTMPLALNRHPGEVTQLEAPPAHMT